MGDNANMGPLAEAEKPIMDHVPEDLKTLAMYIAKGFLDHNSGVLMHYLIDKNCIREEDFRALVKLDLKYMRQLMVHLKQDKLVKERQATEDVEGGKARKISYYFVNYRAIVNVAKYKIDHMRQKLETREKDQTHKASYKCTGCQTTYDALDMDKIFDPMTQMLKCWRCGSEVELDASTGPSSDTRSSLAKLFLLIQKMDRVRLAPHLCEPKPPVAIPVPTQQADNARRMELGAKGFRGHQVNRSEMFNSEFGISVTIDDGDGQVQQVKEKEVVPWLQANAHLADAGLDGDGSATGEPEAKKTKADDEDLLGLLREELDQESRTRSPDFSRQDGSESFVPPTTFAAETGPTDFSSMMPGEVNEEAANEMEDTMTMEKNAGAGGDAAAGDEEEDEDFVFVKGVRYALSDVTTELVQEMTEEERAAYTALMSSNYDDY